MIFSQNWFFEEYQFQTASRRIQIDFNMHNLELTGKVK